MNKITFVTIIFAIAIISAGNAQEKGTSELSLGYGRLTNNEVGNTLGDMLTTIFTAGTVTYIDTEYAGAIHARYKYAIASNLLLGISGAYEKAEDKEKVGKNIVAERKSKIYTIAIESDYSWTNSNCWRLYSGVGLGYNMVDTKSSPTATSTDTKISEEKTHGLGYHINAIGIRAGGVIGVFAEVGYGYRGIVNAGLSIQF
ncbi:hypothetical protein [Maribacter sp. 2210JD10-5]|uniref:hypothetical protein n=1 Tax=Maribacter sp. 2210JD10-5 TaxID=3386272 RepID=UPI0039BCDD4B